MKTIFLTVKMFHKDYYSRQRTSTVQINQMRLRHSIVCTKPYFYLWSHIRSDHLKPMNTNWYTDRIKLEQQQKIEIDCRMMQSHFIDKQTL